MVHGRDQDRSFRQDIQGLRAIGALLVAVFHIWLGRVSGGVDVFFVVSGFLITGSLTRELERTRTIDVVAFWGRIAKRVAPVGYVVLTLTVLAAILWMPASRWEAFLPEIVYSAVHLENFKLLMTSVDYLARDEAPSPLQQFWALSVQVQFYAVWPFLLLVTAAAARRLRSPAAALGTLLGAVFLCSLGYAVVETTLDPSQAYFNTAARIWEFALGGLVAVVLPHVTLPPAFRAAAGWIGLLAVVSCGFVLPSSAAFPGYVALLPTLGAVLVILSGGTGMRFGVDRVLAARPLAALGEISFSFYLWHWPVLIFYLILIDKAQAGWRGGLGVISVALCGAYLTTKFVERPLMARLRSGPAWRPHAVGAAFAAPAVAIALASLAVLEQEKEEDLAAENAGYVIVDDVAFPGAAYPLSRSTIYDPKLPIYPASSVAKRQPRGYREGCHQASVRAEVITCSYGVERGAVKTIALVGGSHSVHWLPALEVLAEKYRWHIASITKSACPFEVSAVRRPSCIRWNEDIHPVLMSIRPDVVFTTSTRSDLESPSNADASRARTGDRAEIVPAGYLVQWKRLAESGITVVAVRDNPRMGINVPECVERSFPDILKCARPRSDLMDPFDPVAGLDPKPTNVSFIDLTDRFCDGEYCYPVGGNVLIYRDKHHLTSTYARSLAPVLGERMMQVRPDLFDMAPSKVERQAEAR